MTKTLIALDTNQIKEFVFATDKLREMLGASALLDDLNRTQTPQLVSGRMIYSHGGSGLFLVESDQADTAIQAVQYAYREQSGGAASIAAAKLALPADFDPDITYIQPYWNHLSALLDAAKKQPAPQAVFTHPLLRPCASDGVTYGSYAGNETDELVSEATRKKRRKRDDIRQNRDEPQDLDALGAQSKPQGYIGLVYADGDSFGQAMSECQTLNEIGVLAHLIYESLNAAISTVTQTIFVGEQVKILQGGDDVVLLLSAHHALHAANRIGKGFAKEFSASLDAAIAAKKISPAFRVNTKSLTLSVSVVWAHAHFPFADLLNLAESALKFAKKVGVKRDQRGLVNFLVVSSTNHLDFNAFYNKTLIVKEGGHQNARTRICRTLRPYTNQQIDDLFKWRGVLKSISRSKLEQVRRAIYRPSVEQAMMDGLSVLTHARMRDRNLLHDAAGMMTPHNANPSIQPLLAFPFVRASLAPDDPTHYAPLADLIEIFDFIGVEKAEEDAN